MYNNPVFLQVATLKDQLGKEMRKRQQFISRGDDIDNLRNILDSSLSRVAHDVDLDPLLLEHETKKLDEAVDYHTLKSRSRARHSPNRSTSPSRPGRLSTPVGRNTRRPSPVPLRSSYRN
jgi:hypothetical protein